jgi:hypothetical protein
MVFAADGRNSAAIAGGAAWPEDIDGTWYVTAGFRWHVDDNWAIEPDFGYWNQKNAQELCLARGCVDFGLRDIHAGGNLLFIGTWGDVGLYTGGGAAAHWRESEITNQVSPPHRSAQDGLSETRLGLQILFGVDIPITNSVDITAAIRDDFIFRDDDEVDLDGVSVVLKVYGGLRFYFE